MRVSAGRYKGHLLVAPSGLTTRPMGSKVKEALFDILGPFEGGQAVLDLFAGTGSLGIEAISRGAQHVVFVEKNRAALNALHKNIARLKLNDGGSIRIFSEEVQKIIPKLAQVFDVIFVDAPYYANVLGAVLEKIGQAAPGHLLGPHTVIVAHHPHKSLGGAPLPNASYGKIHKTSERVYGQSMISFYMMKEL